MNVQFGTGLEPVWNIQNWGFRSPLNFRGSLQPFGFIFKFIVSLLFFGERDGAKRIRTADPFNAIEVLYQLSYSPVQRS